MLSALNKTMDLTLSQSHLNQKIITKCATDSNSTSRNPLHRLYNLQTKHTFTPSLLKTLNTTFLGTQSKVFTELAPNL